MIVCSCHRVSDRLIVQAVLGGASTAEQVSRCTGAGTGCGTCQPTLARVVRDARALGAPAAK